LGTNPNAMRQFFVAMLMLSCINAFSQKLSPTVKWGKEFSAPKRSSLNDIVGYDGTGIYAIKERYGFAGARKYTLEHYDNNFIPTRSFDLDIEENGKDCKVELILQLRGKLYLFTSLPNSKSKKNVLSIQQIDKKTLQPSAEKTKIAEIDFAGESRSNSGEFNLRVSRDSSKVLVFYKNPYDDDEPEGFGFYVLSDNMKPLWNKEVKVPYENELFDVESFRIDNSGDVYLLGLIYKDKRKSKRKGKPNYSYQVFAYRDQGKTLKEYPVSLKDRFLTDMQIEVLNNKDLICAGFYSNLGTFSINGTYFLTVDSKSGDVKTKSFKEFGIDFLTQNMTEKEVKKAEKREEKGMENELYEYDLDKLLVGKDGSAMLIGEQYYVYSTSRTTMVNGMMQTTTTTHYNYNDIITVKVDPTGQIQWTEKIPKRQHSVNDGGFYSSYTLGIVKGRICFLYNDNPRNIEYAGVGKVANYNAGRESIVMLASLTENGKMERQPLFNTADVEVITRPKVCEQVTGSEIILFGQRKKHQQFARISF
jgi:hypothetical protein